jgi:thymidylate synthase
MNNIDKQYQELLQDILDNGIEKQDRTGTGTLSIFGWQIRHKMSDGFPLLTTKKMAWKTMVTELLWFLRGDTNIKFLVDNNCHIWDADAYKNYVKHWEPNIEYIDNKPILTQEEFINKIKTDDEFANKWGELGPIYGKQWRDWSANPNHTWGIDQIANLINDLKTNPDSRRLMVNAWNVGELDQMVLPPCHYGFQVYTRELGWQERFDIHKKYLTEDKLDLLFEFATNENLDSLGVPKRAISLMWNQRSVDTFLGLPFNIASYGLLLEIIAKEVNMVPDELIGNLGDVHLYSNHVEQAKEQIGRDYTLEERLNMVSEEIQNEFSSGIVNLPNFPNTPVWSDDGKMSCLDDFGVPRRTREPYPLPTLNIFEPAIGKKISILDNLHIWSPNCFIIENYQSHPTIKAPLSN